MVGNNPMRLPSLLPSSPSPCRFIVLDGEFIAEKQYQLHEGGRRAELVDKSNISSMRKETSKKREANKVHRISIIQTDEFFGIEDIMLGRERQYTVRCVSESGRLRAISMKDTMRLASRNSSVLRDLRIVAETRNEFISKRIDGKITALKRVGSSGGGEPENHFQSPPNRQMSLHAVVAAAVRNAAEKSLKERMQQKREGIDAVLPHSTSSSTPLLSARMKKNRKKQASKSEAAADIESMCLIGGEEEEEDKQYAPPP